LPGKNSDSSGVKNDPLNQGGKIKGEEEEKDAEGWTRRTTPDRMRTGWRRTEMKKRGTCVAGRGGGATVTVGEKQTREGDGGSALSWLIKPEGSKERSPA